MRKDWDKPYMIKDFKCQCGKPKLPAWRKCGSCDRKFKNIAEHKRRAKNKIAKRLRSSKEVTPTTKLSGLVRA